MNKAPQLKSQTICDKFGHTLFQVEFTAGNGEVIKKTLSPADYAELVGGSLKEERSYWRIRKDFIPEWFVDGAISDENNYHIAFKVPAAQRLFAHSSGNYKIPYPELLFILFVRRGYVQDRRVFCLKKGDETLYRYPFGNVSTDGSICMGNIDMSEIKEYGPSMFAELFFLGKTNNDFVSGGIPVKGNWTQQELLKKLDGKEKFPSRMLVPSNGTFKTLSDVKKAIAKTAA